MRKAPQISAHTRRASGPALKKTTEGLRADWQRARPANMSLTPNKAGSRMEDLQEQAAARFERRSLARESAVQQLARGVQSLAAQKKTMIKAGAVVVARMSASVKSQSTSQPAIPGSKTISSRPAILTPGPSIRRMVVTRSVGVAQRFASRVVQAVK